MQSALRIAAACLLTVDKKQLGGQSCKMNIRLGDSHRLSASNAAAIDTEPFEEQLHSQRMQISKRCAVRQQTNRQASIA